MGILYSARASPGAGHGGSAAWCRRALHPSKLIDTRRSLCNGRRTSGSSTRQRVGEQPSAAPAVWHAGLGTRVSVKVSCSLDRLGVAERGWLVGGLSCGAALRHLEGTALQTCLIAFHLHHLHHVHCPSLLCYLHQPHSLTCHRQLHLRLILFLLLLLAGSILWLLVVAVAVVVLNAHRTVPPFVFSLNTAPAPRIFSPCAFHHHHLDHVHNQQQPHLLRCVTPTSSHPEWIHHRIQPP